MHDVEKVHSVIDIQEHTFHSDKKWLGWRLIKWFVQHLFKIMIGSENKNDRIFYL